MATRTGSGTGVVVSLVVFVLCTVFLLVLTIVFYSGKSKATERELTATATLDRFVTREQRNREQIKALEAKANPARGQSVVRLLQDDYRGLMGYVAGDPDTTFENLKGRLGRYGVADDGSVNAFLQKVTTDLKECDSTLEGRNARVASLEQQIKNLDDEMASAKDAHEKEIQTVRAQIAAYEQAADQYRGEIQDVKSEYFGAIDRLRDEYEDRILSLENEKDSLFQERAVLKGRVDELQSVLRENQFRMGNPAALVDGQIVDIVGGSDEVYINRGSKDRIVLGMTFEVYDNESALQQTDRNTGQMPRGKASLQVTQVRQTTSKCKITRSIPGRPVVREDVIANAVYDPTYVFKFLVHGKFDVDGDGVPSEAEAEFLRSVVVNWGGAVITGDTLPGDLDFLVLGVKPPQPPPLPANATQFQIDDWVRKRRAFEKYDQLFRQASEAQIPVLNSNRFFILIGYTER